MKKLIKFIWKEVVVETYSLLPKYSDWKEVEHISILDACDDLRIAENVVEIGAAPIGMCLDVIVTAGESIKYERENRYKIL